MRCLNSEAHGKITGSEWIVPTWRVVTVLMRDRGDWLPLGSSKKNRAQSGGAELVSMGQCTGEDMVETIRLYVSLGRALCIPLVFPQCLVDRG